MKDNYYGDKIYLLSHIFYEIQAKRYADLAKNFHNEYKNKKQTLNQVQHRAATFFPRIGNTLVPLFKAISMTNQNHMLTQNKNKKHATASKTDLIFTNHFAKHLDSNIFSSTGFIQIYGSDSCFVLLDTRPRFKTQIKTSSTK